MSRSIIDKIIKLKKMAEDRSLGEEEAALYADKVAQLLAEHELSIVDLAGEQENVTEFEWRMMYCNPWRRAIIHGVCALYFCDFYRCKHYDGEASRVRPSVKIVGRPEHIFVAKEMSEYLIATVGRLAKEHSRGERYAALSFERGCGERMAARLRAMKKAREEGLKTQTASGNPRNLPALYDSESRAVKEYMATVEGLYFRKRPMSKMTDMHALAGIAAADNISLADQITADDPGDPS